MATFADIEQIKQQGLAILDVQVMDALGRTNAVASGSERAEMEENIHDLMQRRADLYRWALTADENSPQLDEVLRGLQSATAEMNEARRRMKATSEFRSNAAALLGAADKALAALRLA